MKKIESATYVCIISQNKMEEPMENNNEILKSAEDRLQLGNCVRIYFDFVYYLGICPIRLVKNTKNGLYYAKTWRPQKFLCAILTVFDCIWLLALIRNLVPENGSVYGNRDPIPYFNIVLAFAHCLHQTSSIKRFWLNGKEFAAVLNVIVKQNYLPTRPTLLTSSLFSYVFYGVFVVVLGVLTCMIGGCYFDDPITSMTPSWWVRRTVAKARYTFFVGEKTKPGVAPSLSEVTFWDGIRIVMFLFGQYHRTALVLYAELVILASALTLWATSTSYASDMTEAMQESQRQLLLEDPTFGGIDETKMFSVRSISTHKNKYEFRWHRFYKNFQAIYSLSQAINVSMGSQVTWSLAFGLMYYSKGFRFLLFPIDEVQRLQTIQFYLISGYILYISADICFQLETLRAWLIKKDNIKTVPIEEASIALHALNSADIGIRGSNLVTITYPIVAGYISLIVTFFIICVQQKNE